MAHSTTEKYKMKREILEFAKRIHRGSLAQRESFLLTSPMGCWLLVVVC